MRRAGIIGSGMALPAQVVTNFDLEKRLDTSDEWISKRTGIKERRWLTEDETLHDLALEASQQAIADAGIAAADIDRVIVATATPDQLIPGIAPGLATALGAKNPGAVDVNAACAGFLVALEQGAAMIESGRADNVLVVGAEALSRITDMDDRGTAVLFGDGAGAVVLTAGEFELGIGRFVQASDGSMADLLYVPRDTNALTMNGREVYRHAVDRMAEAARQAVENAGIDVEDIDLLVAHQANQRIIDATAKAVNLPDEKIVLHIDRAANTSAASIPLALADAEARGVLKPGNRVLLAAFGGGFVWGATVITWKESL